MLALLLLALGGPTSPAATVVRFEVVEATRALTPAGPRETALSGTVTVSDGKARWELKSSRFPGVTASVALGDGSGVTLLDPGQAVAASASWEEFAALFSPPPGPEGMSADAFRDVAATVTREGPGTPVDGFPTARYRVSCSFALVSSQPGRSVRVKHSVSGTIEASEALASARTPFDDLLRLFRVRGAAREKLSEELEKVAGLPVKVRLEAQSESQAEAVGATAGPGASARPPARATWTTTRTLSALVRRPVSERDGTLFAVPESYRSRSLDRLRTGGLPP